MSSTFGENLKLSIFGQSHGPAVGMVLDGIPAGLPVDMDALRAFLARRAPGSSPLTTPRKESDRPEFLGGIVDGFTCGAPIAAMIPNSDVRSRDYQSLDRCPRPGHGDYTAQVKYGGFQDSAGGGHFSGRLTAPLCVAGGLCKQWLEEMGISVHGRIASIGPIREDFAPEALAQLLPTLPQDFPAGARAPEMRREIETARAQGDSVGGVIQCGIFGIPAGIGEPMFGGVENRLAQILFGIPGVKGLEFGDGFAAAASRGSDSNDPFLRENGSIRTRTNHCGGILGGISNGMPVVFQVALKPTPSISLPQDTVDLETGDPVTLHLKGRHDPCIVPRAVAVVEAAAALALYDLILGNTQTNRRK